MSLKLITFLRRWKMSREQIIDLLESILSATEDGRAFEI